MLLSSPFWKASRQTVNKITEEAMQEQGGEMRQQKLAAGCEVVGCEC
jgi:hypothetical protein